MSITRTYFQNETRVAIVYAAVLDSRRDAVLRSGDKRHWDISDPR